VIKVPLIIAIDGPAASGKGTLARKIASHYHLPHLDTGLTYRAVARQMLQKGLSMEDEEQAVVCARSLDLEQFLKSVKRFSDKNCGENKKLEHLVEPSETKNALVHLDVGVLSAHEIGEAASKIAVFPRLRQSLVEMQRLFALTQQKGAVLDGRDIGTVVLPQATVKFYVTASPEIRAERRYQEGVTQGREDHFEKILADIIRRDERDMRRLEGALKQAQDAYLLDTTKLTIEEAFDAACNYIEGKWQ